MMDRDNKINIYFSNNGDEWLQQIEDHFNSIDLLKDTIDLSREGNLKTNDILNKNNGII